MYVVSCLKRWLKDMIDTKAMHALHKITPTNLFYPIWKKESNRGSLFFVLYQASRKPNKFHFISF